MEVLTVKNLSKKYPSFQLNQVCFTLEPGKITGFIGRNGAGKSTTLNSLLNFVHPDQGEISFFGLNFIENESEIKERIGFVSSGINYYPKKKLRKITSVTRMFYRHWDDTAYQNYMKRFKLDDSKNPSQLSSGMKVKYALTLALSHNADLLILDEPTSGLDPVSRDDLLEVFMKLCDEGKTILFSTHITSDLDQCADNIIYIKDGTIIAEKTVRDFEASYRLVSFDDKEAAGECRNYLLGIKRNKNGYTGLIESSSADFINCPVQPADLEAIMVHMEKEPEIND